MKNKSIFGILISALLITSLLFVACNQAANNGDEEETVSTNSFTVLRLSSYTKQFIEVDGSNNGIHISKFYTGYELILEADGCE
jgi:hypothetical protein